MTQTYTFNASNSIQRFTVPEGVLSIQIDCVAPKGPNYSGSNGIGGNGGRVRCSLHVTPGQTLYVVAGMTSMDYNASDIRTNNNGITDTTSLNSRVIVAGGGGQGGKGNFYYGGTRYYNGANGGGETADSGSFHGGGGGTQTSGGGGGSGGGWGYGGNPGKFGLGGSTSSTGRGGAGWYGGGSGGFYEYWDYGHHGGGSSEWGVGGGGSSYTAVYCSQIPGIDIHTKGYNSSENGYVKITTSDPIQPVPIDINVNDVITYDDLIGSYVTWLRLNCANVDGYTSQVTAPLMTGYSSVIPGTTIPVTIVESTVIPTITNAQCKNQIDTYLTNCGLYNGQNTLVKTVDLLKYYNALAAFSAAKLVTVCSQFASSVILMYNTNATVPTITLPTNVLPTKEQIQTLTAEFTNMVNRTSKMHTITYTIG